LSEIAVVKAGDLPIQPTDPKVCIDLILCHPEPDFLYVAPSMSACAAFSKESRMRIANAINLDRKSGGAYPDFLFATLERPACAVFCKENRMEFATPPTLTGNPG
jgi:hypothetical protein